jgi:hypothetical protein
MAMAEESRNEVVVPDPGDLRKMALANEHASREKAMDMGRIGVWLGSRENAVIYIALAVIVLSMVGATIMVLINTPTSTDLAKAFGALAISALGYMFGSIGRRDDRHG